MGFHSAAKNKEHKGDHRISLPSNTSSLDSRYSDPPGQLYYRSASSSSDGSDIRFTRKKGCPRKVCLCITSAVIFVLLGAAAGIYYGYHLLTLERPLEKVFRGSFRVISGDVFQMSLVDPDTPEFQSRSAEYRNFLDTVFRDSGVKDAYLSSEILAFDGTEEQDLIVHFNLHVDTNNHQIEAHDLQVMLLDAIGHHPTGHHELIVDENSVQLQERKHVYDEFSTGDNPEAVGQDGDGFATTTLPPPRKCVPLEVNYCARLRYNLTSFPNHIGHKDVSEVAQDFISMREIIDAECYESAYEFICQLIQPRCDIRSDSDEDGVGDIVLQPCRSFCQNFLAGCGKRLPPKLREKLDCDLFPESDCVGEPGCVEKLQGKGKGHRVCDGVMDCPDGTDESQCAYCSPNHRHCGVGDVCLPTEAQCDGVVDCPNSSDERACLTVAASAEEARSSYVYSREGFVMFHEKGLKGKLCADALNGSSDLPDVLNNVGASTCNLLGYRSLESVKVVDDNAVGNDYIQMVRPTEASISFAKGECDSRRVVHLTCSDLECGIRPGRTEREDESRMGVTSANSRRVAHGDWPWVVALFKDGVHVCDASMVTSRWLLTTASCFLGQPKARWVARMGTVRLASPGSPWQEERRVVGMVKSPVEGSALVLVRMDSDVPFSDYVRPVCLPASTLEVNQSNCVTLTWTVRGDQLNEMYLRTSGMDTCQNISITSHNSICMEPKFHDPDCKNEALSGSPLLCQQSDEDGWFLAGISSWRIGCGALGKRPWLYDQVAVHSDWVIRTTHATTPK